MGLITRIGAIRPGPGGPNHDWRTALPVLRGTRMTLRELRLSDAPALLEMLTTEEVARFISSPPTSVEGFERFIRWTKRERAEGRYACFAIVPAGSVRAAGLMQVRSLDPEFGTAEWGFAIGSAYWGTGVFEDAARATLGFVFETIGAHRLEARIATENGRGNSALAKVGAMLETVMRGSLEIRGELLDQALWSIGRRSWRHAPIRRPSVH